MRRRTEAKRNAILKVAEELFRKKGYQNTSMSEITEKVGGSKATIYGYFKSKKLLFEAVMNQASLEEISQRIPVSENSVQIIPLSNYRQMILIIEEMQASKDDLRKTLYRFSKNVMKTVCQPEFLEIYRLGVETGIRSEIGKRFFETGPMHLVENVKQYFLSRRKKGELSFRDAELAAAHFLSLIRGPIFEHHLFNYGKPMTSAEIQRRTRQSVDAFMKIYGTEKTAS